ncbi:MAG: hypothetical protein QNJ38_23170 [Prochloraceae cyanobacterium]|nr:hypothetical protein [Prochloraceae cyanobacterium]
MFNILFKKTPTSKETKNKGTFFLNLNRAKTVEDKPTAQKTEKKAIVKNQKKTKKSIKSLFARKGKADLNNGNLVNLDTSVEVKEIWVDTDMDKFREMAKDAIASRPQKLM